MSRSRLTEPYRARWVCLLLNILQIRNVLNLEQNMNKNFVEFITISVQWLAWLQYSTTTLATITHICISFAKLKVIPGYNVHKNLHLQIHSKCVGREAKWFTIISHGRRGITPINMTELEHQSQVHNYTLGTDLSCVPPKSLQKKYSKLCGVYRQMNTQIPVSGCPPRNFVY